MIKINELLVHPKTNNLIVDVQIENLAYYDKMFISEIKVDTNETFLTTGASDKAYTHNVSTLPSVEEIELNLCKAFEGNLPSKEDLDTEFIYGRKRVRLILSAKALGIDNMNKLFFIYIKTNGIPDECTPCGMDKNCYTLVTYNEQLLTNQFMSSINSIVKDSKCCNNCNSNKKELNTEFMDSIINYQAFKLSIDTGRFPNAIKLWKKIVRNNTTKSSSSNCNCR